MPLLIGTHIHPAEGETARRQLTACDNMANLCNVELINMQFTDRIGDVRHPNFETHYCLNRDSLTVSGKRGTRKPLTSEMFNYLYNYAKRRNMDLFCFTNSDILISQEAVDLALKSNKDSLLFSRMDFNGKSGEELGVMYYGQDTFIARTEWWGCNRWRFRPYIVGECLWDNIYTTIMLCHGDGVLVNGTALVRHEQHPIAWVNSPFQDWHYFLISRDRPYLDLWYRYRAALNEKRARGTTEREELELLDEYFERGLEACPLATRLLRAVKAHARFALVRAGFRVRAQYAEG